MSEVLARKSDQLAEQEARIRSAVAEAFVTAGNALAVIRERKLYRTAEFSTFEEYCRVTWQMSRDFAYKLIAASEVVALLDVDNCIQTPANEGIARELTPLLSEPDKMGEAWTEAVQTAPVEHAQPSITAKHVKAVVRKYTTTQEHDEQQADGCTVDDLFKLIEAGCKFGTLYADPPWAYGNQATRAATDNHYETVNADWLCDPANMPIEQLAADAAHLHLWTTNAFLFEAKAILEAWGFEYKSCFVWVKPQMGIGNYWRVSHEFMLLGVRGGLTFADKSLMSWGSFDRTKHSKKPFAVRERVEAASPGPRLELFGREAVSGWTVWGNEVSRDLLTEELVKL